MKGRVDRRSFIKGSLGAGASVALVSGAGCGWGGGAKPPASDGWDAGGVLHLLPSANHERIRLKASFREPLGEAPILRVGDHAATGVKRDSRGVFFSFDLRGLAPDTQYRLSVERADGSPLCEAWPLKTFPAPDSEPEKLRLLVFTCAGGPDNLYNFGFFNAFVPIPTRQRLFARALSFAPDAAVANGDHVYWDMKSRPGRFLGRSPRAWWVAGLFDRDLPILGTPNEEVLQRAFGPQIAELYGVMFRSLPTVFLQDDHDYGENDEADDALRTFPPDDFMLDLARTTQSLYYPELLADASLPRRFVGAEDVSESFGRLRWGRLFEGLLYDCRRYMTNTLDPDFSHATSSFVPADIERWLHARSAHSKCAHLAQMPSTPVLWSAGKWGEWYPDFKDEEGRLAAIAEKPYWPRGWAEQHDRLLRTASLRRDRTPLFVSGDLHATAIGRILATNGESLEENPVVSILPGAVGTGALGWPSKFRGQMPIPSGTVDAEELLAPLEENGFSLLDFTRDELVVSSFRWTPEMGEGVIETLEPFSVVSLPRPG